MQIESYRKNSAQQLWYIWLRIRIRLIFAFGYVTKGEGVASTFYLLQKREETNCRKPSAAYNTRIITPPRGSVIPTSQAHHFVVAFALGLAVPAGLIYLMMTMNNKGARPKDLARNDVLIVGEIPLCGDTHRHLFGLVGINDEDHGGINVPTRISAVSSLNIRSTSKT